MKDLDPKTIKTEKMNNENEIWWDEQTAADYLKISLNHLYHLRQEKKIVHVLKKKSPICHRKVRRYSKEVLDNYLAQQKIVEGARKAVEEKEAQVEALKMRTKANIKAEEIEYQKGLKAYTLQERDVREGYKKIKAQLTANWQERKNEIRKPLKRASLELSRLRIDLKNLKK